MLIEIALLLTLILINGALAMSETAVISSRPARLVDLAQSGHTAAKRALRLAQEPTKFLSTVQVGITAIGILSGAIGEATFHSGDIVFNAPGADNEFYLPKAAPHAAAKITCLPEARRRNAGEANH